AGGPPSWHSHRAHAFLAGCLRPDEPASGGGLRYGYLLRISEHGRDDELDRHVERLWDHLQTTARPSDREMYETLLNQLRESSLPWRVLGLLGIRPRKRLLPPMKTTGPIEAIPKV